MLNSADIVFPRSGSPNAQSAYRRADRIYHDNGYLAPLDGVDSAETAALCDDLDAFERDEGMRASAIVVKGHLCFAGRSNFPGILNSGCCRRPDRPKYHGAVVAFLDEAGEGWLIRFVASVGFCLFRLDPHELVTVWLALTDSKPENGCVRVIPGSHKGKSYSHVETYDEKNLLARGQSIDEIDDSDAVDLTLRAGQFSCHHERIVHGSAANDTADMRGRSRYFLFPGPREINARPASGRISCAVLTIGAIGMRTRHRLKIAMRGSGPRPGGRGALYESEYSPGSRNGMSNLAGQAPNGLDALTASDAARRLAAGEITSEALVSDVPFPH